MKKHLKRGTNIIAIESCNPTNSTLEIDFANLKFTYQSKAKTKGVIIHTNFGLSNRGETIYLSDYTLQIIDQINYPKLKADNSYGRLSGDCNDLVLFSKPTPGFDNVHSKYFLGYVTSVPEFSLKSNFYFESQILEIYSREDIVRYTTNGSLPTHHSPKYSKPILIDSTMVIRAAVFESAKLPGTTVTKTFFVGENFKLPVFSISTDPLLLFDADTGICVSGPYTDYDVNLDFSKRLSNFFVDKEITAHVEFYSAKEGVMLFEQDLGMKIHGDYARIFPQKSFQFIARKKYGKSTVDYQFFPDKEIYKFKKFILRNAGDEWGQTNFRDGLINKLVRRTYVDMMDYEPTIVFVNGSYCLVGNHPFLIQ